MKTEEEKLKVLTLKNNGNSYRTIAKIMSFTKNCVRGICEKRRVSIKRKTGPKPKINASMKLRIKRKIATLKACGEKVNSPKLIRECEIAASRFTVSRYLRQQGLRYKKVRKILPLKPLDMLKRAELAKRWLSENHQWERTIFSDEKWFSIDGPDDWRSYVSKNEISTRPRHQKKGGGIMVWAMVLPNGLVSFKILDRGFKSPKYIELLSETIVPICKLNYANDFWFQQDNSRIHTARIVKQWMSDAHFPVIEWPARSPDLNITENIWKMLQDIIYDRSPFICLDELKVAIQNGFFLLNSTKRSVIMHLYDTFRKRLVNVIERNGNEINI